MMSPPFLVFFFIRFVLYLQVTRTCLKARTSLTFGKIGPLTMELAALERLKISHTLIIGKWCLQASSFIFDRIFVKLAGNQDSHKISDEFEFRLDRISHFGVTCPQGANKIFNRHIMESPSSVDLSNIGIFRHTFLGNCEA